MLKANLTNHRCCSCSRFKGHFHFHRITKAIIVGKLDFTVSVKVAGRLPDVNLELTPGPEGMVRGHSV